ncbi:MAG: hypothetical protein EOO61_10280 [Hymenobacter sp.]|nr:MAG: hypothetical protein EOO61_10280 [Hymenobacter sp.]
MISNFRAEIEGASFQFNTMSAERLQLFQVYVMDQGVTKRFHVQVDPHDNRFKIALIEACPEPYRHLEDAFHDAIHAHHASAGEQQKGKQL